MTIGMAGPYECHNPRHVSMHADELRKVNILECVAMHYRCCSMVNQTYRKGDTNGVAELGDTVPRPKTVCGRTRALDIAAAVENAWTVPMPYATCPVCGEYVCAVGGVVDPAVGDGDVPVGAGEAPAVRPPKSLVSWS